MNKVTPFISMCTATMLLAGITAGADTEFTYQGELKDNDGLVNGSFMDYSRMTPLLVEAVNALRDEKNDDVATLRADNESLHVDNETLHKENASLRARLDSLQSRVEQLASAQQKEDSQ